MRHLRRLFFKLSHCAPCKYRQYKDERNQNKRRNYFRSIFFPVYKAVLKVLINSILVRNETFLKLTVDK